MFNRPNQNDINDDAQDIRNDVSRLADTLEEVLKILGLRCEGRCGGRKT